MGLTVRYSAVGLGVTVRYSAVGLGVTVVLVSRFELNLPLLPTLAGAEGSPVSTGPFQLILRIKNVPLFLLHLKTRYRNQTSKEKHEKGQSGGYHLRFSVTNNTGC